MRCLVELFVLVAIRSDGRPHLSLIAFKWNNLFSDYLECPPIDFYEILRISLQSCDPALEPYMALHIRTWNFYTINGPKGPTTQITKHVW